MISIQKYNTLNELLDDIEKLDVAPAISEAFVKSWSKIHGYQPDVGGGSDGFSAYPKIMVSISGGADSDVMLDLIERIGYPHSDVRYVFFDTGVEFAATKKHLSYLENKYGVHIERYPAKIPIPTGVARYGVPFLSKQTSEYISRLQKHGFNWEDKTYEELSKKYTGCDTALRWWCNRLSKTKNGHFNIERRKWLKEFLIANPPDFPISKKCCEGAKKRTSHQAEKEFAPDLILQGVRKSEGGPRADSYSSCFSHFESKSDQYRPIYWFKQKDRASYERAFNIYHSDCYSVYGLKRMGCACCPFGADFEYELEVAKQYEPQLYKAANFIFGKSYEYTRKYRAFCEQKNREAKTAG